MARARHTTAVSADAFLTDVFDAFLLDQPAERMKGAPRLERAYPLEILAFEEQFDLRLGSI